jgi:hypothetical protein
MSDSSDGAIRTVWVFDAAQGVQATAQARAGLLGVQKASDALTPAQARAALTAGKLATEQQKTARESNNAARASQLLARDTALAAAAQDRAALSAQRRAAAEARAAQAPAAGLGTRGGLSILPRELTQFGPEALNQIKSGLLGVIGPAAAVTAGFAAVGTAIDLTEESFKLKASLDTVNASITTQLRSIRNSTQVFAEGREFADRYQITQSELSSTLQASIPIMRNSTASTTDLLTQISLLQATAPDKPISEAARALRELSTGDVTTIKELFNVSAADALRMKNAIADGADPVRVLAQYLKDSGASMELLDQRTQGATGKMNALAAETERFQLALAGKAGGPGEALLDLRIAATANATRVLSGDTQTLTQDMNALAGALNPVALITNTVSASNEFAIQKFNELTGSAIPPTFFSINGLTEAWNGWIGAVQSSPSTIPGSQRIKEELQSITRDANAAADAVAAALGNKPLPHITDRGPSVGGTNKGVLEGLFGGGAATIKQFKRDATEAERLADLQFQNRLIKAKDNAAKIRILQEQLSKTTNPIERQQLQNQIDQERRSGTGRVSAAQTTGLQLANVEENAQAAILKAQREGQERLRDAQEDFEVRRGRDQEDFNQRRLKLLAEGKIAEARELEAKFALEQRRDQEDFARQNRRTRRNNAEALGDTTGAADRRSGQIQQRAALRGVGASAPTAGGGSAGSVGGAASTGGAVIQINVNAVTNLDGQAVGNLIFDVVRTKIDDFYSLELRSAPPPNSTQVAVSGSRP